MAKTFRKDHHTGELLMWEGSTTEWVEDGYGEEYEKTRTPDIRFTVEETGLMVMAALEGPMGPVGPMGAQGVSATP